MELLLIKNGRGITCPNKYFLIDDKTIMIEVTDKNANVYQSYIDIEDFEKVSFCNWKIRKDSNTFYLCNSTYGFIHRIINDCPDELTVDHVDGDGLNNRKANLRNVTMDINKLNKQNASLIYYDEIGRRYRVHWRENGKHKSKSFSISRYGNNALTKAEEFKRLICRDIYERPIYN